METKTKQYLIVTVVGVGLLAALFNLSTVLNILGEGFRLVLPIIAGAILAIFINVPVNGIEKRLVRRFKKMKKQPSDKLIHILSFAIALVCILLVLVLILTLVVPEVVRSAQGLYVQIKSHIPGWLAYLDNQNINAAWLEEMLAEINLDKVMQSMSDSMDVILTNVVGTLSAAVNIVITAAFAIIISIYIILGKERLCGHARKLVRAYLKPKWAENILRFGRMFSQSFTNFLTGQCAEAVILGILMFLAFTIFKLPYGSLVGALTAVCAIIPYVGAFISCVVSVFLTLLIDPTLAIRCLIVYLVVQFIENQFIYPRVVGGSVGLSPLYTLIAAMIGGKLFGILGIIFFIPLAAVVIELIKEDAGHRLSNRENMGGV